jgi:membrane protein DedA with SNARE-associated domain
MDFATLITTLGYPAVALGTFLEGETVLMAAGFAAHRGYLQLGVVMLIATCASFASDQTFFWLGRFAGPRLTARWPSLRAGVARVQPMVERHPVKLVLALRFMIGLRTVGPIALGMTSALSGRRFICLSLIGAALWSSLGASAGYFFGQAISLAMAGAEQYQALLAAALATLLATAWYLRIRRRRARVRRDDV